MAKLRHVAIAVADPERAAGMLRSVFGLAEVGRCDNDLAEGVFLSDGTVSIAVLNFRTDQLGQGLGFRGLHHVGFLVDDMAQARKRLAAEGAECVMDRPEGDDTSFFEVKFMAPEGFLFDVADDPWVGSEPLERAS
jgi:methylmalonyl-CoA/ethylmalonyl-CoA epimerase